jgi:AcrR family transcriptional regulator
MAQSGTAHSTAPELAPEPTSPQRIRIVDGALACVARQGVAKTTVEDVAREAGLSRATVYRAFPDGKDSLLAAVVDTEVARLFSALGARMGESTDLSDVLAGGIVEAATRITHHPALRYLFDHEPEIVMRRLAFDEGDQVLLAAGGFTAPFLARWMDMAEAHRVGEWAARIVFSYILSPAVGIDLCDPVCTRHLVDTFMIPGIRSLGWPDSRSSASLQSASLQSASLQPIANDQGEAP